MNIKDVQDLAELAKLELKEGEVEKLIKDMDGILAYVKQIEEVPTPEGVGIDNISNNNPCNIWREDEVIPADFSLDLLVGQFPDAKGGFVKVKKIL